MEMNILVIVGAAPCIAEDLAVLVAVQESKYVLTRSYDYMLIGMDSVDKYLGEVKYFATYHPADIPESLNRRKEAGGNCDFRTISHIASEGVEIIHSYQAPSGSSTLLGVLAAIKMGYQRIILAGCPLEDEKYKNFQQGWQAHLDEYVSRVRSLSGWTRLFLGCPTEEWLDGDKEK